MNVANEFQASERLLYDFFRPKCAIIRKESELQLDLIRQFRDTSAWNYYRRQKISKAFDRSIQREVLERFSLVLAGVWYKYRGDINCRVDRRDHPPYNNIFSANDYATK